MKKRVNILSTSWQVITDIPSKGYDYFYLTIALYILLIAILSFERPLRIKSLGTLRGMIITILPAFLILTGYLVINFNKYWTDVVFYRVRCTNCILEKIVRYENRRLAYVYVIEGGKKKTYCVHGPLRRLYDDLNFGFELNFQYLSSSKIILTGYLTEDKYNTSQLADLYSHNDYLSQFDKTQIKQFRKGIESLLRKKQKFMYSPIIISLPLSSYVVNNVFINNTLICNILTISLLACLIMLCMQPYFLVKSKQCLMGLKFADHPQYIIDCNKHIVLINEFDAKVVLFPLCRLSESVEIQNVVYVNMYFFHWDHYIKTSYLLCVNMNNE